MSDVLKRLLCLVLALVVVFSFSACRKSPVLEQTIYTQDAEPDPNNQQTDNDEEHTDENTTLPPRTQQQSASRQNEQTRVSAKPKPTTGNNTNNNTQNNSQTPKPSDAKPSNSDNSNKAQGNTPGVSDNPDSNIPAIDDRSPVNPDAIPENVKNVAAVGPAALFVEMLGGSNRLLASSANFKGNGLIRKQFFTLQMRTTVRSNRSMNRSCHNSTRRESIRYRWLCSIQRTTSKTMFASWARSWENVLTSRAPKMPMIWRKNISAGSMIFPKALIIPSAARKNGISIRQKAFRVAMSKRSVPTCLLRAEMPYRATTM